MYLAWQIAAFAGGSLALHNYPAQNQQRGPAERRQEGVKWPAPSLSNSSISNSTATGFPTGISIRPWTTETVYTTVNITVTRCPTIPSSMGWWNTTSTQSITTTLNSSWPSAPASNSSSSTSSTTTCLNSTSTLTSSASSASSNATWENEPRSSPIKAGCIMPTGSLTNEEQVGNSTLGTLCNDYYPLWLGNSERAPWGDCTVYNCDASDMSTIPETNVTRYYDFTISRGQISADGVLREVILINNQFPGPLIEANWGDWIQVTVNNNIEDPMEGTSLHWHGQTQKGTPWEDGVPNAGQCPIAPGHSFTYNYRALLHGSSWYHAHYSAQFSAGVAGPMIVHGPSSLPYDIDVGPVMLSDWYHIPYFALVADAVGTNLSLVPPTSDSNLINGRGRFNCSDPSFDKNNNILASNDQDNMTWTCVDDAPLSAFRFESKKTHRLRLINHGANGVQKFTIDNHQMTVIAVDYVPIQPYTTDVITLGVGQRSDVLVTANNDPTTSVWMRTSAPGGEACGGSDYPEVLAAIYYEEANTSLEPTTVSSVDTSTTTCVNDPLESTIPAYSITPSNGSFVQDLGLHLVVNETGHFVFEINGQGFRADFNVPILAQAQAGNLTFAPEWNVYNFQHNTSLILNVTNNMPLAHPFHLHGHNFYVLNVDGPANYSNSAANGPHGPVFANGSTWDGTVVNPTNPTRRDGIIVPPYGYAALQFELDNPGVWPFHCHIAWHLSGGQGMNILYNAAGIPEIPAGFIDDSCQNWDNYSRTNIVDQIDSGA